MQAVGEGVEGTIASHKDNQLGYMPDSEDTTTSRVYSSKNPTVGDIRDATLLGLKGTSDNSRSRGLRYRQ